MAGGHALDSLPAAPHGGEDDIPHLKMDRAAFLQGHADGRLLLLRGGNGFDLGRLSICNRLLRRSRQRRNRGGGGGGRRPSSVRSRSPSSPRRALNWSPPRRGPARCGGTRAPARRSALRERRRRRRTRRARERRTSPTERSTSTPRRTRWLAREGAKRGRDRSALPGFLPSSASSRCQIAAR